MKNLILSLFCIFCCSSSFAKGAEYTDERVTMGLVAAQGALSHAKAHLNESKWVRAGACLYIGEAQANFKNLHELLRDSHSYNSWIRSLSLSNFCIRDMSREDATTEIGALQNAIQWALSPH